MRHADSCILQVAGRLGWWANQLGRTGGVGGGGVGARFDCLWWRGTDGMVVDTYCDSFDGRVGVPAAVANHHVL